MPVGNLNTIDQNDHSVALIDPTPIARSDYGYSIGP